MTDGSNRGVGGQEAEPLNFPSTSETKPANRLRDARTGWFKALLAVERNGSFAGASRELGVSEKAARDLIKEFEAWLGFDLVVRQPKGKKPSIILTERAEFVSPNLHSILSLVNDIQCLTLNDVFMLKYKNNGSGAFTGRFVNYSDGTMKRVEFD